MKMGNNVRKWMLVLWTLTCFAVGGGLVKLIVPISLGRMNDALRGERNAGEGWRPVSIKIKRPYTNKSNLFFEQFVINY